MRVDKYINFLKKMSRIVCILNFIVNFNVNSYMTALENLKIIGFTICCDFVLLKSVKEDLEVDHS